MPAPQRSPRPGHTLVELLVAVLLLEVATTLFLVAVLTHARLDRATRARSTFDLARRDTVAMRAADPTCRGTPTPEARDIALPIGPGRPALTVAVRCGR